MSELRTVLERGIGSFEPDDGSLIRILRRTARRQRNRRLGAALVASVVALAGVGLAGFAFLGRSRGPATGGAPITSPFRSSPSAPGTIGRFDVRLIAPGSASGGDPSVPVADLTSSVHKALRLYPDGHQLQWAGLGEYVDLLMLYGFPNVEPGAELHISGDATRVRVTYAQHRAGQDLPGNPVVVDIRNGVARLPTEPGGYQIDIVGYWPAGHAGFVFNIGVTG